MDHCKKLLFIFLLSQIFSHCQHKSSLNRDPSFQQNGFLKLSEEISHIDNLEDLKNNEVLKKAEELSEKTGEPVSFSESKEETTALTDTKEGKSQTKKITIIVGSVVVGTIVIGFIAKEIIRSLVLPAPYLTNEMNRDKTNYLNYIVPLGSNEKQLGFFSEQSFKSSTHPSVDPVTFYEYIPENEKPEQKGYIFMLPGNADFAYSHFDDLIDIADQTGYRVVAINYPKGLSNYRQMVDIGKEMIAGYMTGVNGVKAENVTLLGHSIGGAFVSHIASDFHQEGKKVRLITDRSFTKIAEVVKEASGIPTPVGKLILGMAGWNLDPETAVRSIDPEYQTHFYSGSDEAIQGASKTSSYQSRLHLPEERVRSLGEIGHMSPRSADFITQIANTAKKVNAIVP